MTNRQTEGVEKGKYPKPQDAVWAFRLAVAEVEAAEKQMQKK